MGIFGDLQKLRDNETAEATKKSRSTERAATMEPAAKPLTSPLDAMPRIKPATPRPAASPEQPATKGTGPSKSPKATPVDQPPLPVNGRPDRSTLADHIDEQPYMQANFQFTEEELKALDSLKHELRQDHDIRATKNNIVRCALHLLFSDYEKNGKSSFAVNQLLKVRR